MQSKPLRVAFFGLASSEVDLFTLFRRAPDISLVFVVDPGPMGIVRRLAEIAGVKASSDPWDLPPAQVDWIVAGRLARSPMAPLQRAAEAGAVVLTVAEAIERLTKPEMIGAAEVLPEFAETETTPPPAIPVGTAVTAEPVAPDVPEIPSTPVTRVPAAPPTLVKSGFLQPTEREAEPCEVVGWALDGLMSSVRSLWGVALARANGDTCLVERGIKLESSRPEIWRWLKTTVEKEERDGLDGEPPPEGGELAWVPLKSEAHLIGAVVLGRAGEAEPFSNSDRTWLQKVGERIASILSYTAPSVLKETTHDDPVAPAAVWAAPVLERAEWARGWMKGRFEADACWLFAAMEDSSEVRLVDESWGPASPPFLLGTIRAAMERNEPQVWLESGESKALVLQPLGPWGVKWTVVLEGVPWRGDGRATLARLKKAAVTLSRLLKSN